MTFSVPVPITRTDAEQSLAETSLAAYIRQAWHVIEPATPFVTGWHIEAICEHLEAVSRGEIRNLIINIPPRNMKSISVAVMWPTWEWITRPHERYMFATYAETLTIRDSIKRRQIIESPWYQERWGDRFQLRDDQNTKKRFDNDKTGFMLSTSVGGMGTGEGGSRLVADDVLAAKGAQSDATRAAANTWWSQTMSTRLNNPKTGARIIIMQRLHEDDLVGHILEKMQEEGSTQYEHLMLPARFEPDRKCFTSIGFEDPRTEYGQLLWPERFDNTYMTHLETELGSYDAAAQLQQRPAPDGGGLLRSKWVRFHVPRGMLDAFPPVTKTIGGELFSFPIEELPPDNRLDDVVQSWDLTFKKSETSDYVSGQVWARSGGSYYMLDRVHDRMDVLGSIEAIRTMSNAWPKAVAKLIEDRANGPAVISILKKELHGIIPINPEQSKEVRAAAIAPILEAGNVYLPHPRTAPWVWEVLHEMDTFPFGKHDDDVDAMSQLLSYFVEKGITKKRVRGRSR